MADIHMTSNIDHSSWSVFFLAKTYVVLSQSFTFQEIFYIFTDEKKRLLKQANELVTAS